MITLIYAHMGPDNNVPLFSLVIVAFPIRSQQSV